MQEKERGYLIYFFNIVYIFCKKRPPRREAAKLKILCVSYRCFSVNDTQGKIYWQQTVVIDAWSIGPLLNYWGKKHYVDYFNQCASYLAGKAVEEMAAVCYNNSIL